MPIPPAQKQLMSLISEGSRHVNSGTKGQGSRQSKSGWIVGGDDYRREILPRELEEACRCFREANAVMPDVTALNQLGLALESLGRYGEAEEAFRQVVDVAQKEESVAYANAGNAGIARCSGKAKDKAWIVQLDRSP
jgi:tetratricopeptide (TPR) repeat protein